MNLLFHPVWTLYEEADTLSELFLLLEKTEQINIINTFRKIAKIPTIEKSPSRYSHTELTSILFDTTKLLKKSNNHYYNPEKDIINKFIVTSILQHFFNFLVTGITAFTPKRIKTSTEQRLIHMEKVFGPQTKPHCIKLDPLSRVDKIPPCLIDAESQCAVLALMSLHWFTDHQLDHVAKEIRRLLKPGGVFILHEHDALAETTNQTLYIILYKKLMSIYLDKNIADLLHKKQMLNIKSLSQWRYWCENDLQLEIVHTKYLHHGVNDLARPFILVAVKKTSF
jgi:SAM-dependent methyltransferase